MTQENQYDTETRIMSDNRYVGVHLDASLQVRGVQVHYHTFSKKVGDIGYVTIIHHHDRDTRAIVESLSGLCVKNSAYTVDILA